MERSRLEISVSLENIENVTDCGATTVKRKLTVDGPLWPEFMEDFGRELHEVLSKCGLDPVECFAYGAGAANLWNKGGTAYAKVPEVREKYLAFLRAGCDLANAIDKLNA